MNVVTRSLMATGLLTYAGIHLLQGLDPPAGAPVWLRLAFLVTAAVAVVLAFGLLFRRAGHNELWKAGAAALAVGSAVALVIIGNLDVGIDPTMGKQAEVFGVIAAELLIFASWGFGRMLGPEYNEVDG